VKEGLEAWHGELIEDDDSDGEPVRALESEEQM
jgi:hypothetical protein